MASTPKMPEGHIRNSDESMSAYLCVVHNTCISCGEDCHGSWAMAIGSPYHAMLHWRCRAWMPTNSEWPHQLPAAAYYPSDNVQNKQLE